ncbi:MFS transporter [Rhodovarius crocodyli]|uniref:MFS transporter n=1 Tax=Rhodovarius crocodyli TaxID=1979269 RepID=A0A437MIM6_9PROT|nr:MFS transporter [Rhodovarius crocodyli]RVT97500.1 MFS transporter [Rhodovarius crocodyli]
MPSPESDAVTIPSGGSARRVALLGAIAFVSAMGATIVFSIGAFAARGLGVPLEWAALTSSVFSASAGVGGLIGALFLARVSRRVSLVGSLIGLGLFTILCGLAPNFSLLLAARVLSGLCAGPLMAAVLTIIVDAVPEERRNRAVSAVTGSYGLALVLGMPLALLLSANLGGWRAPFLALGLGCLALAPPAWRMLAPAPGAQAAALPRVTAAGLLRLLARRESLTGLALISGASFATLLISPNLSAYALHNAGVGETGLRLVFLIGGTLALVTTRLTGWAMDRIGPLPASVAMALALSIVVGSAFLAPLPAVLAVPVLGMVLSVQLARSTVAQASATRVASPAERITFQCLVAAVTSLAQSAGAGFSALVLQEQAGGALWGMEWLALLSIAVAWTAPLLVMALGRLLPLRPA